MDVTDIAKAMIGCTETSRQRYGANVIMDTLHGANTAKIRNYGMNENPHYAVLSKVPVYKLRQVMNHLLLKEYLSVTNDEYAIVKLTQKAGAVLNEEETILMKMAKEEIVVSEGKENRKTKKSSSSALDLSKEEEELFEKLRTLRLKIAKEEKVPPYIVFSDKTLIHMSVQKPKNREEMLLVSGVGTFKYDKYGERFLEILK